MVTEEFETSHIIRNVNCLIILFCTRSYRGSWSVDGCRLAMVSSGEKTDTRIACECDHMTNFAVIERRPIGGQVGSSKPLSIVGLSCRINHYDHYLAVPIDNN